MNLIEQNICNILYNTIWNINILMEFGENSIICQHFSQSPYIMQVEGTSLQIFIDLIFVVSGV